MVDARLPSKWLTNAKIKGLSDDAFHLLTMVGMRRAVTGTYDEMTLGEVADLPGEPTMRAVFELIEAGIWTTGTTSMKFTASYIEDTRPFDDEEVHGD